MEDKKTKKQETIKKIFLLNEKFCEEHKFNEETKKLLDKFLGNFLGKRRTPTVIEWGEKLNKLNEICEGKEIVAFQCIKESLEKGWLSFYLTASLQTYFFSSCDYMFEDTIEERKKMLEKTSKLSKKEY